MGEQGDDDDDEDEGVIEGICARLGRLSCVVKNIPRSIPIGTMDMLLLCGVTVVIVVCCYCLLVGLFAT